MVTILFAYLTSLVRNLKIYKSAEELEILKEKSLNISAPSLRFLAWKGSLMNHPSLSNLELLEEAAVFLNPKVDVLDQVFELFYSLRKAKLLFVKEQSIRVNFHLSLA